MPIPNPHGIVLVNPDQEQLCVGWWDVEQHTSGSLALAQVGDVSGTALLVESWNEPAYGWNNDFGQTWGAGAFSNQDAPWYPAYGLSLRHRQKTNVAFCDGHVALLSQAELSGDGGVGTCPWDFAGAWTAKAGD
jgi:prepilin-type processing-associated H-X9-DG protein